MTREITNLIERAENTRRIKRYAGIRYKKRISCNLRKRSKTHIDSRLKGFHKLRGTNILEER